MSGNGGGSRRSWTSRRLYCILEAPLIFPMLGRVRGWVDSWDSWCGRAVLKLTGKPRLYALENALFGWVEYGLDVVLDIHGIVKEMRHIV